MLTLVHYGEIALKGKNRRFFEDKLTENIKRATGGRVRKLESRLVVEDGNPEHLKYVFGISWFAPAYRVEKNLGAIVDFILKKVGERVGESKSFGVFVKRADKRFPYTSPQIAGEIGAEVARKYGLKVRLKDPELPIYVEIAEDAFVYFEKIRGLGGLPVSANGRVLCLLSGGIDSAVASYLIMKRGCRVDFIHFHVFPQNKSVVDTKISDLVEVLNRYQFESKVFLVPYYPFQLALLNLDTDRKTRGYELVLFRRFMLRVSERIANRYGYQALVTGDSLGQVASQTLENIRAVSEVTSLPVFRPLIAFDKQEIIDIARRIETYEISIRPYKDCCSIVAPHPKTRANLERLKALEEKLGIDEVVKKSLELADVYPFEGSSLRELSRVSL